MADLIGFESVHMVGVGGSGMSALAKLLYGNGTRVTGSDQHPSEVLASLGDLGMEVWNGHRPERVAGARLVVASSAVPDSDPELLAAQRIGIPTWRRPELLGAITSNLPTLAATGTHGKSSTSAMLLTALRACGLSPSMVVGAELVEFRTNAMVGSDDWLVLEADEAFGTFESLHLKGLIVTNIDFDHGEFYGDLTAIEDAFLRVATRVDGPVVICRDDPGGARLAVGVDGITYGSDRHSTYRIVDVDTAEGSAGFRVIGPAGSVPVRIPRTGIHMIRNAAGVLALVSELGQDVEAAAAGLATFMGLKRRFENRGTVRGVTVIDDYAHHPTEVAATVTEARAMCRGTLWAVFQPHLFSRTERFATEFGAALSVADRVVVTDVYGSREEPRPGVTGDLVAEETSLRGAASVAYVQHREEVARFVAPQAEAGDLVVIMGAGDITVSATELLMELAQ